MPRFPIRLLGESDFILIISCAGDHDTGGGLCVFDGSEVKTIDRVSTAGLTVFEGRIARLLRTPLSTGGGEMVIYDRRGISRYLRVDELWDAHYLTWDGKQFIIASTGNNSLLWVTTAGEITRRWRAPGEYDSCHLNEAYIANGRIYGCAFTKSREYRGYKQDLHHGSGFVFELESGREVIQGLSAPHNPRYADGLWTICDSVRECVRQFDASTGREIRRALVRSFARGLTLTDDFWIVGESGFRSADKERSVSGDESGNPIGEECSDDSGASIGDNASFAILRRSDLSFVARFELPFREVSDIVVAPRHLQSSIATGFRTNPLRVGEADQLHLFHQLGVEPTRVWAVSDPLEPPQCRVRVEAEVPPRWAPGKLELLACQVTNLAEAFLSSALPHPVYISYKWVTPGSSVPLGEGLRNRLPRTLAPGESMHSYIDVKAPETEGRFQLILTLVQEGVCWFDSVDIGNARCATVDVVAAAVPMNPPEPIQALGPYSP